MKNNIENIELLELFRQNQLKQLKKTSNLYNVKILKKKWWQILNIPINRYFSNKIKIVIDEYNKFEIQIKRWWFPFWIKCWKNRIVNSFNSLDDVKKWIQNGRKKDIFKSEIIYEQKVNKNKNN
jgi:hypothetical protein